MDPRLLQLIQQMQAQRRAPVARFYDGGSIDDYLFDLPSDYYDDSFDLGGLNLDDFNFSDLGTGGLDLGGLDVSDLANWDVDVNAGLGLENLDLGSFEDLAAVDALKDVGLEQFNPAKDSQLANELIEQMEPGFEPFVGDALAGYLAESATPSAVNIDGKLFSTEPAREKFNAAKDSQAANKLIEAKEPGFEQFGGDARAGYAAEGATPNQVTIDGKTYGGEAAKEVFNAAKDSQLANKALGEEEALAGYRAPGATPKQVTIDDKTYSVDKPPTTNKQEQHTGTNKLSDKKDLLSTLLPMLLMMMAMNRGGGGSRASTATIPALTATQRQTPYTQIQQAPGYRPGQGGIRYFEPTQYAPKMAGGGVVDLARALAAKRREQRQGLLKGRGDGVSDSIPGTIDGQRPARLARGEYVVDARTVAELGNGSTDAGAERLDEMRRRVHAKRKKAGVGQDSKAYKHLPK